MGSTQIVRIHWFYCARNVNAHQFHLISQWSMVQLCQHCVISYLIMGESGPRELLTSSVKRSYLSFSLINLNGTKSTLFHLNSNWIQTWTRIIFHFSPGDKKSKMYVFYWYTLYYTNSTIILFLFIYYYRWRSRWLEWVPGPWRQCRIGFELECLTLSSFLSSNDRKMI